MTQEEGKQVITACAFIHQNIDGKEKLFLPKRALTKKFLPGVVEVPGGHIEFGEDIIDGLKREIMEEFSMHITVGDPFYVFTYTNELKGAHYIEVIYFCKFSDNISNIKLNPEDHSEFIWIEEAEIETKVIPGKGEHDPEIGAIRKGFELIRLQNLDIA